MKQDSGHTSLHLMIIFLVTFLSHDGQVNLSNKTELYSIVEDLIPALDDLPANGRIVIFTIRFSDLGCQPCLQNFFDLCDSLNSEKVKESGHMVCILFLRNQNSAESQKKTMMRWLKACGLSYPFTLVTQDIFAKYGIDHSSVLIIEKSGNILFTGKIPVPWLLFKKTLAVKNE